jgi:hypothetical protein
MKRGKQNTWHQNGKPSLRKSKSPGSWPLDPLEDVPAGLLDLAEPGETALEMQARLWSLWLELNGKLMLGLATTDETALHSRLHNELHWFAPPIEGE